MVQWLTSLRYSTSNVNRTIANVRNIFNKKGGNIGAAGSVVATCLTIPA
ncbi:YebC/PmpR family DNA-binding transcriptional regulator [Escherichia coli]